MPVGSVVPVFDTYLTVVADLQACDCVVAARSAHIWILAILCTLRLQGAPRTPQGIVILPCTPLCNSMRGVHECLGPSWRCHDEMLCFCITCRCQSQMQRMAFRPCWKASQHRHVLMVSMQGTMQNTWSNSRANWRDSLQGDLTCTQLG